MTSPAHACAGATTEIRVQMRPLIEWPISGEELQTWTTMWTEELDIANRPGRFSCLFRVDLFTN